jgi:hypothetical protein
MPKESKKKHAERKTDQYMTKERQTNTCLKKDRQIHDDRKIDKYMPKER